MMAPRKDLMKIIRRDDGFAATLGFGSTEGPSNAAEALGNATGNIGVDPSHVDLPTLDAHPQPEPAAELPAQEIDARTGNRGIVIYVAVSLTEAQAMRAERWAAAASCSVQLLMRRTAQAMRKDLFDVWAETGVERVEELRGTRGHHPTSITLTLPKDLAAAFSAQLDPLGIIGLGRALGPAFRKRFATAFETAAENAGF